MAITKVGAFGAVASGTSTTITPAFGQATTAGNLLVACVSSFISTTATTEDITTSSIGWLLAIKSQGSSVTFPGLGCSAIFYKPNCGASETAPTFTGPTGTTVMSAVLSEWSGAALSSSVENSASGADPDAAINQPQFIQMSIASPSFDLVIVAAFISNSKSASWTLTPSWPAPTGGTAATIGSLAATKATTSFIAYSYLIQGHAGTVTETNLGESVNTGSLLASNMAMAAFRPKASFLADQPNIIGQSIKRSSLY